MNKYIFKRDKRVLTKVTWTEGSKYSLKKIFWTPSLNKLKVMK